MVARAAAPARRVLYEAAPLTISTRAYSYAQASALLLRAWVPVGTRVDLYGPGGFVATLEKTGASTVGLGGDVVNFYNANATTLPDAASGSPAILRLGSTPAPTWGTPGDESTGGIILPVGQLSLRFCGALPGQLLSTWARGVVSVGTPAAGDVVAFGATRASDGTIWAGGYDYVAGATNAHVRQYIIGTTAAPSPGGTATAAYQEVDLADADAIWMGRGVLASYTVSQRGGVIAGAWREADDTAAATSQQAIVTTTSSLSGETQTAWLYRSATNLGARVTRLVIGAPVV